MGLMPGMGFLLDGCFLAEGDVDPLFSSEINAKVLFKN
jgi:hypothetical protein